ncbi:hypothetical protein JCM10369A_35400 [Nocardioides pyridinolyticus]
MAYDGGPVDVDAFAVPFQIQFGESPSAWVASDEPCVRIAASISHVPPTGEKVLVMT